MRGVLIGLPLLGFLFFYALLIMTLAVAGWAPESGLAEFVFYLVTGLGWTPPAAFIIQMATRHTARPTYCSPLPQSPSGIEAG